MNENTISNRDALIQLRKVIVNLKGKEQEFREIAVKMCQAKSWVAQMISEAEDVLEQIKRLKQVEEYLSMLGNFEVTPFPPNI